jgi:hypothetical protein
MPVYILDDNGDFLLDQNGNYIIQSEIKTSLSFSASGSGSLSTDLDGYTPYSVMYGYGDLSTSLSSVLGLSSSFIGTSTLLANLNSLGSDIVVVPSGIGNLSATLDIIFSNVLEHVIIDIGGNNVTKYLIEYTREHQICTGIHTCNMSLVDTGINIQLWDEIILYEYDRKIAIFIVSKIDRPANEKRINLELQDYSKKMTDYLITDIYDLTEPIYEIPSNDYMLDTDYWIGLFLDEANIAYDIVTSGSSKMGTTSSLGMQMLYDQIVSLLQMNGWFFYFDKDGVCIIDKLTIKKSYSGYTYKLTDKNILKMTQRLDDNMLRNWAVVWGNSNPQYPLVFISKKRGTSWQIDEADYRAVVLSNHSIYKTGDATRLANEMLATFSPAIKEIEVEFVNDPGIFLGDLVYIQSDVYDGIGRATTVSATCNAANGLTNTVILNQRCPRLFAFLGIPPEPGVYQPVSWLTQDYYHNMPGFQCDDLYTIQSANLISTSTIVNIMLL